MEVERLAPFATRRPLRDRLLWDLDGFRVQVQLGCTLCFNLVEAEVESNPEPVECCTIC